MEHQPELAQPSQSTKPPSLQFDFQWRKFKTRISDTNNPEKGALYIVDYNSFKKPSIVFKRVTEKEGAEEVIGSGTLHTFGIDADYELHGRKDTLVAQRRWHTSYSHRSLAVSSNEKPVKMIWSSDSDFKTWDFICCDEQQMPVAKFSANIWATKKMGKVEFMGPSANSKALHDEIVVTGLTLFHCMVLRTSSLLSFFGAIFASPGHDKKWNEESQQDSKTNSKPCSEGKQLEK
ncbi:hypothetical protein N7462_010167 [Penicillium macrosclerotiorum]|uniref:uncharacterized protein n=1 Tax=Penicillium macrosclerotiorum TaxID=303699 RepID=UPI0025485CFC|nr:uncharacterized protein N7462_010167 [Penicillium macrosclerotiorum]KAJ5669097.1 hypothetical protein N7462_010167 [Penicillium macrosclerotiorum]